MSGWANTSAGGGPAPWNDGGADGFKADDSGFTADASNDFTTSTDTEFGNADDTGAGVSSGDGCRT
jgi:hypothetical protein